VPWCIARTWLQYLVVRGRNPLSRTTRPERVVDQGQQGIIRLVNATNNQKRCAFVGQNPTGKVVSAGESRPACRSAVHDPPFAIILCPAATRITQIRGLLLTSNPEIAAGHGQTKEVLAEAAGTQEGSLSVSPQLLATLANTSKREPLPSIFACLFCNHEKSVAVKLDKKVGIGQLHCKVCGKSFQSGINCTFVLSTHLTL
jgi:Transcription elongation factor Elf1 like